MIESLAQWLKQSKRAWWLLPLVAAQLAHGQTVRAPDLGIWLVHQRGTARTNALVVADLIADGVFASAGLREGDRIVSINGRPIDREPQFVQPFLGNQTINLVINRNDQQLTLSLKPSAVTQNMVPIDPFYQAGFLLDESTSESLVVQRVFSCTPAFYAGLRPADHITGINDRSNPSRAELTKALRLGGDVTLAISRNGEARQMTLLALGRGNRLRNTMITGTSTPGAPLPPPTPYYSAPSAPLLAPPNIPSHAPPIPSPPPAIPSLPPPGTVR